MVQYAEQLYEASFAMLPLIAKDCRQALTSAAFVYREQLNTVRKNHYSLVDNKNKINRFKKIQLLNEAGKFLKQ